MLEETGNGDRKENRKQEDKSMDKKRIRKRKKWPWVLGVLILGVTAAVIFLPSMMPAVAASNIESVTATKGSITETVVGTGNLESRSGDETELKIPVGIIVAEVHVEEGDDIVKGDLLATIDPLSLQHRIASVRSEIQSLDADIHSNRDDDGEEIIRTGISGRVKKIFVEKGDLISDVMSEHGLLMLISIDGNMAVDIETTAELSVGDSVTVVRENGSRRTGEITRKAGGTYTITLSDNGPRLDEIVEILGGDRNIIGTGSLYIHQPISVVASSGSVKTIHVSENESVSRNRRLVTLEHVAPDPELQQMLTDRDELVEYLNMLLTLTETHSIFASADGSVTGILISEGTITGTSAAHPEDDDLMVAAFILVQDEETIFTIEVDELDILSIQIGQEATIVFNAIPDREFTGIINDIATSSHSQSGVAKYAVEVSLIKDELMRIGMNATATINISYKDNIITIPLEALQELAGSTFVYTENDEQTGTLSGIKYVVTGVSDGMFVEIISGLSEEEVIYYATRAVVSTVGFGPGGGMPGGGGFGRGEQGGQPPQGG